MKERARDAALALNAMSVAGWAFWRNLGKEVRVNGKWLRYILIPTGNRSSSLRAQLPRFLLKRFT